MHGFCEEHPSFVALTFQEWLDEMNIVLLLSPKEAKVNIVKLIAYHFARMANSTWLSCNPWLQQVAKKACKQAMPIRGNPIKRPLPLDMKGPLPSSESNS